MNCKYCARYHRCKKAKIAEEYHLDCKKFIEPETYEKRFIICINLLLVAIGIFLLIKLFTL